MWRVEFGGMIRFPLATALSLARRVVWMFPSLWTMRKRTGFGDSL
jgi:hypothetical protein